MSRGDKNYSERTHKVVDKSSDAKQKEVWDMIGAKKKLQEMVEALINGDSKAAAASLHDYLQVKTRAILGEESEDGEEMVADRHDDDGEEHEHAEGEVCPECGEEPCECEGEHEAGEEDFDADSEFGGEEGEGDEHGEEDMHEGARGEAVANDASVRTSMKKLASDSKDIERKVKGNVKFKTNGKAKLTHPHNNAAPGLDRKVKGDVKFKTNGKAKLTKPFNNAAPGLDRKVKGEVKF